jgi:FkbM family methyltransferase
MAGVRNWRGLAASALRRAGLGVTRITPGAVLVTRAATVERHGLGGGAALVTRSGVTSERWFDLERRLSAYVSQQHLAELLRRYRVNVVLDVGANRGQYGRRLRRIGFEGHIVSFEPVLATFAELQEAAAADPRWTAYPYALGREETTASMNVVPGTLSSLLPATEFGAARYSRLREPEAEEVQVRRLDNILDEVLADVPAPRPYLKLDTQGFDLEAFAGLGDRVSEIVAMQSEVSVLEIYAGMPPMMQAVAAYEAAGFEITALFPVSREAETGRVLEFDCVMVRADARASAAGPGATGA